MKTPNLTRTLLPIAVAAACLIPGMPPAAALLLGIAVAALPGRPRIRNGATVSRVLLQVSVVALGLGLDIHVLLRTGLEGLGLSALTVAVTFAAGILLAKLLRVERSASRLVSAGTAICGGSAIAAVAQATRADDDAVGTAMGTVFLLNAVALVIFPPLGHILGMDPHAFGTWAGVAVHDVSSVVGAAAAFSPAALPVAIATKLARTLWIIPISLVAAHLTARRTATKAGKGAKVPLFLLGFIAASLLSALLPPVREVAPILAKFARSGFTLALFLVGLGVHTDKIRQSGWRILAQGTIQWALTAGISLTWILTNRH